MPPRHPFFVGKNQVTFQDTIFLLLHALYVFLGALVVFSFQFSLVLFAAINGWTPTIFFWRSCLAFSITISPSEGAGIAAPGSTCHLEISLDAIRPSYSNEDRVSSSRLQGSQLPPEVSGMADSVSDDRAELSAASDFEA
jgi:hypothetical protein